MNLNNSLEAPTNTKHIKNVKYREKKRTTQPTNNTAHKQHGPQTTQPTNNTAHKQHSPQTTQPTNNTAHKQLCRRNISSHSYDKQSSVRAADDPQKRPNSISNMPNRRPDDRLHISCPDMVEQ
jgi:hypothetical protein